MLVLTRKYQEKIRIGDNITITILRTKGKAVRLGIEAPTDVPVIRGELTFERKMPKRRQASRNRPKSLQAATSDPPSGVTSWKMPDAADTQAGSRRSRRCKRVPRGKVGRDSAEACCPADAPLRAMTGCSAATRRVTGYAQRLGDATSRMRVHATHYGGLSVALISRDFNGSIRHLRVVAIRKILQLGQLLEQHAANLQHALRMTVDAAVVGRHDDSATATAASSSSRALVSETTPSPSPTRYSSTSPGSGSRPTTLW